MSDVSEEISPDDVPVGEDDLMPEDELLGLEFADNPEPRCPGADHCRLQRVHDRTSH